MPQRPDLSKMKDEDYKLLTPRQLMEYNMQFPETDYQNPYNPAEHPYPKAKYRIVSKDDGSRTLQSTTVQNAKQEAKLSDEWKDSPADFGIETAPAAPEIAVTGEFTLDLPPAVKDATQAA
jgi:hypothetical protein